jgi:hypothetical protein
MTAIDFEQPTCLPEANPLPAPEVSPETERTLSEARLCAGCGTALTGRRRQAQHCSARCRAEARRTVRQQRLAAKLEAIVRTVDELRQELGLDERARS